MQYNILSVSSFHGQCYGGKMRVVKIFRETRGLPYFWAIFFLMKREKPVFIYVKREHAIFR